MLMTGLRMRRAVLFRFKQAKLQNFGTIARPQMKLGVELVRFCRSRCANEP